MVVVFRMAKHIFGLILRIIALERLLIIRLAANNPAYKQIFSVNWFSH